MSNFRAVDRGAAYLLPRWVDERLPADHPARFVVEIVEQLDQSGLTKQYRGSGPEAVMWPQRDDRDPVGALLLCGSPQADYTVVRGRVVTRQGQLATVELGPLVERHNRFPRHLAESAC